MRKCSYFNGVQIMSISRNEGLGQRIRQERERLGLSQKELAEQIGVQPQSINDWENDRHLPQPVSKRKLSEVLDVSIDELFMLQGDDSTSIVKGSVRSLALPTPLPPIYLTKQRLTLVGRTGAIDDILNSLQQVETRILVLYGMACPE